MNKEVLKNELERLQSYYNLSNDYIEGAIIKAKMELLEVLLEACQ